MKISKRSKSIEELIAEYAKYASEHGQALEVGDYKKGNKAHDKLIKIYLQIKKQGDLVHPIFKEMLYSSDIGIQAWVAVHLLEISPEEAETVLTDIGGKTNSRIAFSARITLEEWKKGTLDLSYI